LKAQAKSTSAAITDLKGRLPAFSLEHVFEHSKHPELDAYWQLYGFNSVLSREASSDAQYYFGAQTLADYAIASHYWSNPSSRGTVLVVHGLFDHVGLYLPLVKRLLDENYSVFAIDLPEHGLSSGEYGDLSHFQSYYAVIDDFAREVMPVIGGPWFSVGQSTGASVLMGHILLSVEPSFERSVFFAPLVRPKAYWSVRLLHLFLSPFLKRIKRSFTVNSHDQSFCDFLKYEDPLQQRYISVAWVGAMLEWVEAFSSFPVSDHSVFIVQGRNDSTVDSHYNIDAITQKFPNIRLCDVLDSMHHITRESQGRQKQAFDLAVEFLEGT
jgi:alpha-beta hydrolase superfamily lysophospholipase